MLVLVFRTVILYFAVVLSIRIMGKRQIGEMQPSELVVAIMISDLASVPMQSVEIPILSGIIPVLTLLVAEVTMSFVSLKSKKARRYITGEPSVVIYDGHINEGELERMRFNLNDLMEQLRLSGCPNPYDVKVAVLETNGQLSVIKKTEKAAKDLPYIFITDGDINDAELKRAGKTKDWLKKKVKEDCKNIFMAVSEDGNSIYIQKKGERDK